MKNGENPCGVLDLKHGTHIFSTVKFSMPYCCYASPKGSNSSVITEKYLCRTRTINFVTMNRGTCMTCTVAGYYQQTFDELMVLYVLL